MRKILFLIAVVLIATFFVSCGEETVECTCKQDTEWPHDVGDNKYDYIMYDFMPLSDAEELVDAADLIFIGRVTDIGFRMVDFSNSTSVTPGELRPANLYHCIEIDVIEVYKDERGYLKEKASFLVPGGMPEYKVEEQQAILKSFGQDTRIPIRNTNKTDPERIGEAWLFIANRVAGVNLLNNADFVAANMNQYCYYLDTPSCRDRFGITVEEIMRKIGHSTWRDFKRDFDSGVFASDGGTK